MAHFALICPPFASHIHSLRVLGEELAQRGHRATFVLNAGAEGMVQSDVLAAVSVPQRRRDPPVQRVLANATRPAGLLGTLRTIVDSAAMTDQLCAGGPELLRRIKAEAVIADQLEPAGGLLAAALDLPQVSLAAALPINRAPAVPLPFLAWPYDPSPRGVHRVRAAERIGRLLSRRQNRTIARWSDRFGLSPRRRSLEDCLAQTQIAQVVRGYDFPRPEPAPFEGLGPLRTSEEVADGPLPFDPDARRPLVFATMGTLQGGRVRLWRQLARACHQAGAELAIAHGGQLSDAQAKATGADHAFAFLPYRAVLKRSALCVTHGGSNTVLDALACGVPLLVRPVGFDQKGNLSRILHHGLGERLARWPDMSKQVRRLIEEPQWRDRAWAIAEEIGQAGGVERAANIVEAAVA